MKYASVLEKRDYPMWMLNRATNIVKCKSREDLLKFWPKKDNVYMNKPTFVTTYSCEFFAVKSIINKYLPLQD